MEIIIALVVIVAAVFIGLAIAGVILRAACHLAGVDVPGLGHAMGIVFITGIIQAIIGSIINVVFGVPVIQDVNTQVDPTATITAGIVSFLINTPVTMMLYNVMIPTESFGKAALVWLMQVVIVICIVLIIVVLVFALSMALGGL